MPMDLRALNTEALNYSFDRSDLPDSPVETAIPQRELFYFLVNIDEHPEVIPMAHDLVRRECQDGQGEGLARHIIGSSVEERVASLADALATMAGSPDRNWQAADADVSRRRLKHVLTQYLPLALVDGCWLQTGCRVSTAHTHAGATITGLYQHQVRGFVADTGRHFAGDYRLIAARLGLPGDDVSSDSFAKHQEFAEGSFTLPVFLLAIGQFTRTRFAEIVGVNLAWQWLGLSAFGPNLIAQGCRHFDLPAIGDDLLADGYAEKGRELAKAAAVSVLEDLPESEREAGFDKLLQGAAALLRLWRSWEEATTVAAPAGPPNPQQEMVDLMWRKAAAARGYHGNRPLGARKIDEYFDIEKFNGPALLDALASSPWIRPGDPDKSPFLNRLIGFGGPMLAVFSPAEQQVIRNWILSLPPREKRNSPEGDRATALAVTDPGLTPTVRTEAKVKGRMFAAADFRRRSEAMFGKCSIRDLYHHLVNVEFFPEILPVAERFARDRLERSRAMIWKGERPIPSRHYSPRALDDWLAKKHREQVDSYRPPAARPDVPKDAFIETTVQLAPLILIDGAWLQGMASPPLIHTSVARMMFHVFVEEIGEGKAKEHHANIYRDLLTAMGVSAPPVDSRAFADWERLQDSSFEIATLWLAISCFPRHFMPEILGLNLAVELAGVGGPYMEARDTLRRFRYPTLFVDTHNAADNVTAGHAAWATSAIKHYMDQLTERQGPHHLDETWHRIWSGVRATLPQIGRMKLMVHRARRRFLGRDPAAVPLIFPS
ncbi:MAG: iron-containing redox enzyme family protein [Pseudomonadota bacterium]